VEEAATDVTLDWRRASGLVDRELVSPERVLLGRRGAAVLDVRRDPPTITLDFPDPVAPEAIVHPLLTPPIAILARWRGDLTLHAGAFLADGRAWGVIGEREAGKSTTLARLAERGCPILADDLLVLDQTTVYAGPACIDLRPDVAELIPGTQFLGDIAGRPRHRLSAPAAPAKAELGGFFLLDWSEEETVAVEPLDAQETLRIIYGQEYIGLLGAADPKKILELLGMPAWRVRRPADWRISGEVLDRILEVTGGQGAARSPARRPE
jgi:hypothetical protein